jgi:hypothetical protein
MIMSKKKGFDIVEYAHERANHNINPYYWIHRITPSTMAQWRTNKYFAPLFFIIYSTIGILWLNLLNQTARVVNRSVWSLLFDFSGADTIARFTGFLLFSIFWVIAGIATVQNIVQRIYASPDLPEVKPGNEKKKKYPKRPKNYK